jgi:hypothetical protein
MKDELLDRVASIFREAEHRTLAALHAIEFEPAREVWVSEWMTPTELAIYWRCINKEGEPTTAGIFSWARRPIDQHPLPHAHMGDMMRFHRDEVNQWAKEEAARRKTHSVRKRIKVAG